MNWRKRPKVCKPRSGAHNVRAYKSIMIWQHPYMHASGHVQGETALGGIPYRGLLRSSILPREVCWEGTTLRWAHHCGRDRWPELPV